MRIIKKIWLEVLATVVLCIGLLQVMHIVLVAGLMVLMAVIVAASVWDEKGGNSGNEG